MAKCPNCEAEISFKKAVFGRIDKKGCPNCGVRLTTSITYRAIIGAVGGGTGSVLGIKLGRGNFSTSTIIVAVLLWLILYVMFSLMCLFILNKYEIID